MIDSSILYRARGKKIAIGPELRGPEQTLNFGLRAGNG